MQFNHCIMMLPAECVDGQTLYETTHMGTKVSCESYSHNPTHSVVEIYCRRSVKRMMIICEYTQQTPNPSLRFGVPLVPTGYNYIPGVLARNWLPVGPHDGGPGEYIAWSTTGLTTGEDNNMLVWYADCGSEPIPLAYNE